MYRQNEIQILIMVLFDIKKYIGKVEIGTLNLYQNIDKQFQTPTLFFL